MRRVLISLAAVLYCALAQAAGIDSLKSLDLGNFEITRIREVKTPADLGLKKAGAGRPASRWSAWRFPPRRVRTAA